MSILVATDFTPEGNEAVRVAAEVARGLDEPLIVIHVLEESDVFPNIESVRWSDTFEVRAGAAQKMLAALKCELEGESLTVTTEIGHGAVEDALLESVGSHKPTMAVLGGFGDGSASYHGVADALAPSLPCPVLVIRPSNTGLRSGFAKKRPLRIFLAIDRSPTSDAPLAFVRGLCERIPCDVVVDYLYWQATEHDRLGIPISEEQVFEPHPAVVAALQAELRARVGRLAGKGKLEIRARPRIGSIERPASSAVRAFDSDLVVVGSHRRRGLSRLLHGSVSLELLRKSQVPVLVVGHDVMARQDVVANMRKVLVATDLTPMSRRVVAYAIGLIGDQPGELELVCVDSSPVRRAVRDGECSSSRTSEVMETMRSFLPAAFDGGRIRVSTKVLDSGHAADAILQEAARWNADAICMGSRGIGPVERALTGSVSTDVVQRADCPVLIVRTHKD